MKKAEDGDVFIGGVGIYPLYSSLKFRRRKLKDLILPHCPDDEGKVRFWDDLKRLREIPSTMWLPCGIDGNIAVVHNHDRIHLDCKTIDMIKTSMTVNGFVGFMFDGGTLVLQKGENIIFKKFCSSLNLRAIL